MNTIIRVHQAPKNIAIGRAPTGRTTAEFTALVGTGVDLDSLSKTNKAILTQMSLGLDKIFRVQLNRVGTRNIGNFVNSTKNVLKVWAAAGATIAEKDFRKSIEKQFDILSRNGSLTVKDMIALTKMFASEGFAVANKAINEQIREGDRVIGDRNKTLKTLAGLTSENAKSALNFRKATIKQNAAADESARKLLALELQFDQLKAATTDATISTKNFDKEVEDLEASTGGVLNKMDAARKAISNLRDEIDENNKVLERRQKNLRTMASLEGESTKKTLEFRKSIIKQKKATDEADRKLASLRFQFDEIKKAIGGAANASRDFDKELGSLRTKSGNTFTKMEAGKKVLSDIRSEMNQGKKSAGFLSSAFAKNASQLLILVGVFGTARFLINDFIQGVSRLATAFFEAANKAAELADAEVAFRRLATAQAAQGESASVALAKIRDAAGGTIDQLTLLGTATKGALAGLDPQKFDKIVRGARALAAVTGRDTAESMDRLTQAIAKQERRLLDELGIVIRANDAYKIFARQVGKSTTELTANEKQIAFTNAVLSEIDKKVSDLGGIVEFAQGPFIRFKAAVRDTSLAFGEAVRTGGFFKDALEDLSDVIEGFGKLIQTPKQRVEGLAGELDIARAKVEDTSKTLKSIDTGKLKELQDIINNPATEQDRRRAALELAQITNTIKLLLPQFAKLSDEQIVKNLLNVKQRLEFSAVGLKNIITANTKELETQSGIALEGLNKNLKKTKGLQQDLTIALREANNEGKKNIRQTLAISQAMKTTTSSFDSGMQMVNRFEISTADAARELVKVTGDVTALETEINSLNLALGGAEEKTKAVAQGLSPEELEGKLLEVAKRAKQVSDDTAGYTQGLDMLTIKMNALNGATATQIAFLIEQRGLLKDGTQAAPLVLDEAEINKLIGQFQTMNLALSDPSTTKAQKEVIQAAFDTKLDLFDLNAEILRIIIKSGQDALKAEEENFAELGRQRKADLDKRLQEEIAGVENRKEQLEIQLDLVQDFIAKEAELLSKNVRLNERIKNDEQKLITRIANFKERTGREESKLFQDRLNIQRKELDKLSQESRELTKEEFDERQKRITRNLLAVNRFASQEFKTQEGFEKARRTVARQSERLDEIKNRRKIDRANAIVDVEKDSAAIIEEINETTSIGSIERTQRRFDRQVAEQKEFGDNIASLEAARLSVQIKAEDRIFELQSAKGRELQEELAEADSLESVKRVEKEIAEADILDNVRSSFEDESANKRRKFAEEEIKQIREKVSAVTQTELEGAIAITKLQEKKAVERIGELKEEEVDIRMADDAINSIKEASQQKITTLVKGEAEKRRIALRTLFQKGIEDERAAAKESIKIQADKLTSKLKLDIANAKVALARGDKEAQKRIDTAQQGIKDIGFALELGIQEVDRKADEKEMKEQVRALKKLAKLSRDTKLEMEVLRRRQDQEIEDAEKHAKKIGLTTEETQNLITGILRRHARERFNLSAKATRQMIDATLQFVKGLGDLSDAFTKNEKIMLSAANAAKQFMTAIATNNPQQLLAGVSTIVGVIKQIDNDQRNALEKQKKRMEKFKSDMKNIAGQVGSDVGDAISDNLEVDFDKIIAQFVKANLAQMIADTFSEEFGPDLQALQQSIKKGTFGLNEKEFEAKFEKTTARNLERLTRVFEVKGVQPIKAFSDFIRSELKDMPKAQAKAIKMFNEFTADGNLTREELMQLASEMTRAKEGFFDANKEVEAMGEKFGEFVNDSEGFAKVVDKAFNVFDDAADSLLKNIIPTATFRGVTEPQANQLLLLNAQQANFLSQIAINTATLPTIARILRNSAREVQQIDLGDEEIVGAAPPNAGLQPELGLTNIDESFARSTEQRARENATQFTRIDDTL